MPNYFLAKTISYYTFRVTACALDSRTTVPFPCRSPAAGTAAIVDATNKIIITGCIFLVALSLLRRVSSGVMHSKSSTCFCCQRCLATRKCTRPLATRRHNEDKGESMNGHVASRCRNYRRRPTPIKRLKIDMFFARGNDVRLS